MAIFTGTSEEFDRYIGPRLKNVVNAITKKHKAAAGACEHCGAGGVLEAAHVAGRERTEIIDLLLRAESPSHEVEVDLNQFEAEFKFEHQPIEKAILVLCRSCHQKYDSRVSSVAEPVLADSTSSNQAQRLRQGTDSTEILPITLDPSPASAFKERLLERKVAELTIFYGDGRTEMRTWDASNFSEKSNVFGNLRSRPELRQGEWQSRGIVAAHVRA
jgi:transcription elongation factor Elf1